MTLLHPGAPSASSDPLASDAEALIREARRRTRRRRARWSAALVTLLVVGAALDDVVAGGSGAMIAETGTHPFVNLHAFTGHGELAFISRGRVWVLDGRAGTLRRLPTPGGYTPSSPVFSHDGRWLAYLARSGRSAYGPFELWIAHGDGTGVHRVRGLAVNQFIGWSPDTDLVAVTAGESTHVPYDSPTALDVISPPGHARALFTRGGEAAMMRHGAIRSAVWAPDGRSLAMSTYSPDPESGTQILDVPVRRGARPRRWFSIANTQHFAGAPGCGPHCLAKQTIADLAGWWPKWGLAFWVVTSGMDHNSDATPLAVLRTSGARPRVITHTLSDGTTDAVSSGPAGRLSVVASTSSAGREYALGKTVENCSPSTFRCAPIPGASTWTGQPLPCNPCFGAPATGRGSAVSLDPAWSPTGTLLAYVKAPAYRAAAGPDLAWYQAHELYVWNTRTNQTRRIGQLRGSSLPTWSRNGTSLLYVSGDGLWLVDPATGKTTEIEHPLYPETQWKNIGNDATLAFYGQIPWSRQFSWHSP